MMKTTKYLFSPWDLYAILVDGSVLVSLNNENNLYLNHCVARCIASRPVKQLCVSDAINHDDRPNISPAGMEQRRSGLKL